MPIPTSFWLAIPPASGAQLIVFILVGTKQSSPPSSMCHWLSQFLISRKATSGVKKGLPEKGIVPSAMIEKILPEMASHKEAAEKNPPGWENAQAGWGQQSTFAAWLPSLANTEHVDCYFCFFYFSFEAMLTPEVHASRC